MILRIEDTDAERNNAGNLLTGIIEGPEMAGRGLGTTGRITSRQGGTELLPRRPGKKSCGRTGGSGRRVFVFIARPKKKYGGGDPRGRGAV